MATAEMKGMQLESLQLEQLRTHPLGTSFDFMAYFGHGHREPALNDRGSREQLKAALEATESLFGKDSVHALIAYTKLAKALFHQVSSMMRQ